MDGRLTMATSPFALRASRSRGKNQLWQTCLRTMKHSTSYWVILEQMHNINSITLRQCSCSLHDAPNTVYSMSVSRSRSEESTVSQYLTEEGSDSELQHSDEHTATLFERGDCLSLQRGFCRAVHRDSDSAQHSQAIWCALAGRPAASCLPDSQYPMPCIPCRPKHNYSGYT